MKLPPLRRTYGLPFPLNGVEEQVAQAIEPVLRQYDAQSLIYADLKFVAGQAKVLQHGLRQTPTGYRVIRSDAPAIVYDDQAGNLTPERTLVLYASIDAIVTLEVF